MEAHPDIISILATLREVLLVCDAGLILAMPLALVSFGRWLSHQLVQSEILEKWMAKTLSFDMNDPMTFYFVPPKTLSICATVHFKTELVTRNILFVC